MKNVNVKGQSHYNKYLVTYFVRIIYSKIENHFPPFPGRVGRIKHLQKKINNIKTDGSLIKLETTDIVSDMLSYCNLSSLIIEIGFDILQGHQSTLSTRRRGTRQLPIYSSYIREISSASRLLS